MALSELWWSAAIYNRAGREGGQKIPNPPWKGSLTCQSVKSCSPCDLLLCYFYLVLVMTLATNPRCEGHTLSVPPALHTDFGAPQVCCHSKSVRNFRNYTLNSNYIYNYGYLFHKCTNIYCFTLCYILFIWFIINKICYFLFLASCCGEFLRKKDRQDGRLRSEADGR